MRGDRIIRPFLVALCDMKIFKAVLSLAALAAFAVSCGNPKDIDIVSYNVTNISVKGLRSAGADLVIEVENPSVRMKVHGIKGIVRQGDTPLATFVADDVVLAAHSTRKYVLPCVVSLDDSFSIMTVLGLLGDISSSDLKLDVSCECRAMGVRKKVERKGVSLSKLIKT